MCVCVCVSADFIRTIIIFFPQLNLRGEPRIAEILQCAIFGQMWVNLKSELQGNNNKNRILMGFRSNMFFNLQF